MNRGEIEAIIDEKLEGFAKRYALNDLKVIIEEEVDKRAIAEEMIQLKAEMKFGEMRQRGLLR